jgi:Thioesterase superfamily
VDELLDVVTRAYKYQRVNPALLVGTTSGLETVQLTLEGKLPTPPFGYAVHTVLPAGRGFTTLDLHVRFVRAVTVAVSRLRVEAQVTHAGNRTVTAEGRIVGPDGKVYATGTTSCLVLKMEE